MDMDAKATLAEGDRCEQYAGGPSVLLTPKDWQKVAQDYWWLTDYVVSSLVSGPGYVLRPIVGGAS